MTVHRQAEHVLNLVYLMGGIGIGLVDSKAHQQYLKYMFEAIMLSVFVWYGIIENGTIVRTPKYWCFSLRRLKDGIQYFRMGSQT